MLLSGIFSVGILSTLAADNTGFVPNDQPGKCPAGYTGNCGNYQLNDFMQITIIASNFILGLVGSLALLAFVVGGLMWMLSGGKAELVSRGKQTILGAVIGLAIVFTSFMIIQMVYASLGLNWQGKAEFPSVIPSATPTTPNPSSSP